MPVSGTLITKASVVSQINADLVTGKNSRVVWWTGNPVNPNPGFGALVASSTTGDLAAVAVTASQIVSAAKIYANDSTRIRQLTSRQWNPSCGVYSIDNGTQVSALSTAYYVTALQSSINSTPGPSAGTLITAASINNFTAALQAIANQSEAGAYLVDGTTNDGCHCSCHSSCHSACHSSCHASCHSSRARR